jgi:hypothetical protein
MVGMKNLTMVMWLVSGLAGCVESDVVCEDNRSWNEFYESCVDPCPMNQDYDAEGICVDIPGAGSAPDSSHPIAHIRYETPASTTSSASR